MTNEAPKIEESEEQVQMLINLSQGKGKTGKGKGNGPIGGNGFCFNCGGQAHFVSICDGPNKENSDKWTGTVVGKKDGGRNKFVEAFKAVGLQMQFVDNAKHGIGLFNVVRPMFPFHLAGRYKK